MRAFCAKGLTPEQRARADLLRKIKPYVQAWYGTWHENMLDQPFYRVNSQSWACWIRSPGSSSAKGMTAGRARRVWRKASTSKDCGMWFIAKFAVRQGRQ